MVKRNIVMRVASLALFVTTLVCGAEWTAQQVGALRSVSSVAMSPDGSRVAFTLSVPRDPFEEENGPAWGELHVIGSDGVSRPFITGQESVASIDWTPDGKSISFLAKRGKDEFRSLYVIDAAGGEARRVLAHDADINSYSWSPDGQQVVFLANEAAAKEKKDLEKKGFTARVYEETARPSRIWVASPGGEAKAKVVDVAGSASELEWGPAGSLIAVAIAPTSLVDQSYTSRRIHVIDVATGKIVAKVENPGKLGSVVWSPDGKNLAYATVFSGFYIAFMLVLFVLILRAVSLEFRSKMAGDAWRRFWDGGFFLASLLAPILFGVAVGSVMVGVPVDAEGIYAGGFFDILFPARMPFYPLLVGLLTASLFTMHGAIYLYLKTEDALQERARSWMWHGFGTFLVLYLLTTIVTLVTIPHAMANFTRFPWAWGVVLLTVLAIGNIPRAIFHDAPAQAFFSSSILIVMLVGLVGIALFPNLLVSSIADAHNLTIYNAASSQKTLGIMAIIAALGMPFVLAYTAVIYWTFRGKVRIGEHSY